jgi:hypothetical protein
MREILLTTVPTSRQINTAFHQDEGIILDADTGEQYAFVPQTTGNNNGIAGKYTQVAEGKFTSNKGDGELVVADKDTSEPSAKLLLLDQD